MATNRFTKWSTEDNEALDKYKADLEDGKVNLVEINRANINSILNRSS